MSQDMHQDLPQKEPEHLDKAEPDAGASKLVPVGESIKYRRRAQQAETKLQDLAKSLQETQTQLQSHQDQLAASDAQRDEAMRQLTVMENRLSTERMLLEAGVVDLEAASLLLAKRIDIGEAVDRETLTRGIEQLLTDKPFLLGPATATLPPATSSAKLSEGAGVARLAHAADRAVHSGDRRDVAEYLRMRRHSAQTAIGATGR